MGKTKGAVITLYICNNYIFSKEMLEDTSFRQSTHKPPPGAVCVAGLAVNQNREHPLGCKYSKLLVERLQTTTPMEDC